MNYPRIGLAGKSGSGKSSIAKYIAEKYGYKISYPGGKVRFVTKELFDSEKKSLLNKVSSTFRKLRPRIWLDLALDDFNIDSDLIVVDGIRYPEDYIKLKELGFLLVLIHCSNNLLTKRLEQRDGTIELENGLVPYEESALKDFKFDVVIDNENVTLNELFAEVDRQIIQRKNL